MIRISRKKELWFAAVMTLFSAALLARALSYPPESSQFPRFLLGTQLAFCLALLGRAVWKPKTAADPGNDKVPVPVSPVAKTFAAAKIPIQIFVASSAYILAIEALGYFVATAAFLSGTMYLFGKHKPLVLIGLSLGFLLTIYALFVLFIGVRLPQGFFI